jgi:hypothetical protein
MAIVVETGAVVAGANSYVSVADLRDYADDRGISLPSDDTTCEPLLIKATDYLEAQRNRYQGYKTASTNPLQFPRADVWIDGYELSSTAIPVELKKAQMQLACDAYTQDLMPSELPTTKGALVSQKIDVIEVTYSQPASKRSQPWFQKAESFLQPLYQRNGLFAVRA